MSRARGPSIVHAVADDLDQAIEDITHDWSLDRNQQWITRTATASASTPPSRPCPTTPPPGGHGCSPNWKRSNGTPHPT